MLIMSEKTVYNQSSSLKNVFFNGQMNVEVKVKTEEQENNGYQEIPGRIEKIKINSKVK